MKVPRTLLILLVVFSIFLLSKNLMTSGNEPGIFDIPKKLQENKMSLKVWPYSTINGAQVFSLSKSGIEEDRLYLEPAASVLDISSESWKRIKDSGYVLKLYGAFYKGKGIPQRFISIRPAPGRYSVFRYESMDIIKE